MYYILYIVLYTISSNISVAEPFKYAKRQCFLEFFTNLFQIRLTTGEMFIPTKVEKIHQIVAEKTHRPLKSLKIWHRQAASSIKHCSQKINKNTEIILNFDGVCKYYTYLDQYIF